MELRTDGVVLNTDHTGYLVKLASADRVQTEWGPPLCLAIEAYRRNLGAALRNVYVRGSIPLGRARKHISDIDMFAILECNDQQIDLEWAESHNREIIRCFPFVKSVEFLIFSLTTPRNILGLAALVKTQSACVHGIDFSDRLPSFKPGIHMISHGWELPRDVLLAKRAIEDLKDAEQVRQTCFWLMKRIVRCGFELVMEDEGCFTRDLYPCYEMFAQHFPEKAKLMETALGLAINPTDDRAQINGVIDKLGGWLHEMICIKYGARRIGHLLKARPDASSISNLHSERPAHNRGLDWLVSESWRLSAS